MLRKKILFLILSQIFIFSFSHVFAFSLTDIKASDTTATTTKISWVATGDVPTYLYITYRTTPFADTSLIQQQSSISCVSGKSLASSSCAILGGLLPNTTYYYKINSYISPSSDYQYTQPTKKINPMMASSSEMIFITPSLPKTEIFTAASLSKNTSFFNVPSHVTTVTLSIAGGGGGGGVGSRGGCYGGEGGGGGGAEAYKAKIITGLIPNSTLPVVIGLGGGSQQDGGNSSFGDYITALGGKGANKLNLPSAGGASGGSGGTNGQTVINNDGLTGKGGATIFGLGGAGKISNGHKDYPCNNEIGNDAPIESYGAGGGGGADIVLGGKGGKGADGIVKINYVPIITTQGSFDWVMQMIPTTDTTSVATSSDTVSSSTTTISQQQTTDVTTTQNPTTTQTTIEQITKNVTKKITGSILSYSDNTLITDAEILAYNETTQTSLTTKTDTFGKYSLILSPGTWRIGVRPTNELTATWQKEQIATSLIFLANDIDETKNLGTTFVKPKMSSLSVKLVDENNNPLSGIGVILDTKSILDSSLETNSLITTPTATTDATGFVTFKIKAGNYYIRNSKINTSDTFKIVEESIALNINDTKTIILVVKKETALETVTITSTTKFDNGSSTDAFIYAWSERGDRTKTDTATSGVFSLTLAKGQTWHIGARKDARDKSYTSTEQTITTTIDTQLPDFVFTKNDSVTLPPSVAIEKNTSEQITLKAEDGAQFSLPSNTLSGSTQVNIEIKPTTETPSEVSKTVVSTAYDITIKNKNSGASISNFTNDAEILIPYDEEFLKSKGTSLEKITPSYYDEKNNTWVSVSKFSINKEKKVFVVYVNHLTRFALIALADTIAPNAPSNVRTDAITPTDIKITWQNQSSDIHHIKIYRSEKLGVYGNLIAAEVFSNYFIDTTKSITKKTYYYTVRSVDTAGNESKNINQLATTVLGSNLALTSASSSLLLPPGQIVAGKITRLLKLGSKGDDVTSLQQALKKDGFYVTGPITGYYGKLTQNAVFRFQNYYKKELLIPYGYTKGTGVVGPSTRKKINEILATNS